MAELDAAARTLIQTWIGTIGPGSAIGQEEDIEVRLEAAPALIVALEVLLIRLADMEALATTVRAGDQASDHAENLKRAPAKIASLAAAIRGNTNLSLTEAQEAMVSGAEGLAPAGSTFQVVRVDTDNRRVG